MERVCAGEKLGRFAEAAFAAAEGPASRTLAALAASAASKLGQDGFGQRRRPPEVRAPLAPHCGHLLLPNKKSKSPMLFIGHRLAERSSARIMLTSILFPGHRKPSAPGDGWSKRIIRFSEHDSSITPTYRQPPSLTGVSRLLLLGTKRKLRGQQTGTTWQPSPGKLD